MRNRDVIGGAISQADSLSKVGGIRNNQNKNYISNSIDFSIGGNNRNNGLGRLGGLQQTTSRSRYNQGQRMRNKFDRLGNSIESSSVARTDVVSMK